MIASAFKDFTLQVIFENCANDCTNLLTSAIHLFPRHNLIFYSKRESRLYTYTKVSFSILIRYTRERRKLKNYYRVICFYLPRACLIKVESGARLCSRLINLTLGKLFLPQFSNITGLLVQQHC